MANVDAIKAVTKAAFKASMDAATKCAAMWHAMSENEKDHAKRAAYEATRDQWQNSAATAAKYWREL